MSKTLSRKLGEEEIMHELSVVKEVIRTANEYADKNEANKVDEIFLRIGVLNRVIEPVLFKAFQYASKGTKCEGAELSVAFIPLTLKCESCEAKFNVSVDKAYSAECPKCGGKNNKYVSGREFVIDYLKVT